MNTFLTIAGSDPSGGAGIQADIKTASALGIYSMSVITAITIQNTLGVKDVFAIPYRLVGDQADAVFSDIMPDCTKIGMCVNSDIIHTLSDIIIKYSPRNIVLDTILISTSGRRLLSQSATEDMKQYLFPKVDVITPNVPEAEYLLDCSIYDERDMERAAAEMYNCYGCNVLLKGGHLGGCDILYNGSVHKYKHKLINNPNTHGTGCTLSSALAVYMSTESSLEIAANKAIAYTVGAISDGLILGHGNGPLNHLYNYVANVTCN